MRVDLVMRYSYERFPYTSKILPLCKELDTVENIAIPRYNYFRKCRGLNSIIFQKTVGIYFNII